MLTRGNAAATAPDVASWYSEAAEIGHEVGDHGGDRHHSDCFSNIQVQERSLFDHLKESPFRFLGDFFLVGTLSSDSVTGPSRFSPICSGLVPHDKGQGNAQKPHSGSQDHQSETPTTCINQENNERNDQSSSPKP